MSVNIRITADAIVVPVDLDIELSVRVAARLWQALSGPKTSLVYPTEDADKRTRFLEEEVEGLRRDAIEANEAEDRALQALVAKTKALPKLKVRTCKDKVEAAAAEPSAPPVPSEPSASPVPEASTIAGVESSAAFPAPAEPGLTLVQVSQSLHIPMTEVNRLIARDSLRVSMDTEGLRRVSREDLADFRRRYKTKGGKAA